MLLHSLDPANGRRIGTEGASFTLLPLMHPADEARVVLLELAAGDCVPEHDADGRQLFCVLRGEGWVSGQDSNRVRIREMQAAQWSPGERHAAGTEQGMLAIAIEGSFTVEAPSLDGA
jgi:quercetin dioxygenase-like cupin family protein